ncbi:MAG: M20/M25/M40 family metallo-hydrolase [Clostridia bacterium]
MDLSNRILEYTRFLVSVRSETATDQEVAMGEAMLEAIKKISYFNDFERMTGLKDLEHDPLNRAIAWGLYFDPDNTNTVVLVNHFDTVDTWDYKELREISIKPNKLMEKIKSIGLNKECLKDLASGHWMFGRGTADMKGGAAIQLAVMENHINNKQSGSILFLSVPDEETLSTGMRQAVKLMNELKVEHNLNYKLLIDSETHVREEDDRPVIYKGSIGKIMPTVFVKGVRAHAGNVYQGLNPIAIASEIVRDIELNQELCDEYKGEKTPGPTWLYLRDNKKGYDVSLPESAYAYLNILTFSSSPQKILNQVKEIAKESFSKNLKRYGDAYVNHYNKKPDNLWPNQVYLFSELFQKLESEQGKSFIKDWNDYLEEVNKKIVNGEVNMPKATGLLSEFLANKINNTDPVVIIALAPPYYPHVILDYIDDIDKEVNMLETKLKEYIKKEFNNDLKVKNFYTGISDMSYSSLFNAKEVIGFIEPNMPLWGQLYDMPLELMAKLQIPSINLGPWGKDLHMMSERIYLPDLLYNTPKIMDKTIQLTLKEDV